MNVSMGETTADRFSVYMNFLRYVSSNIEETSGLYQAVLWKFVEERIKSGESTHQVPETSFRGRNYQAFVWKNGQMLPRHEVLK